MTTKVLSQSNMTTYQPDWGSLYFYEGADDGTTNVSGGTTSGDILSVGIPALSRPTYLLIFGQIEVDVAGAASAGGQLRIYEGSLQLGAGYWHTKGYDMHRYPTVVVRFLAAPGTHVYAMRLKSDSGGATVAALNAKMTINRI